MFCLNEHVGQFLSLKVLETQADVLRCLEMSWDVLSTIHFGIPDFIWRKRTSCQQRPLRKWDVLAPFVPALLKKNEGCEQSEHTTPYQHILHSIIFNQIIFNLFRFGTQIYFTHGLGEIRRKCEVKCFRIRGGRFQWMLTLLKHFEKLCPPQEMGNAGVLGSKDFFWMDFWWRFSQKKQWEDVLQRSWNKTIACDWHCQGIYLAHEVCIMIHIEMDQGKSMNLPICRLQSPTIFKVVSLEYIHRLPEKLHHAEIR